MTPEQRTLIVNAALERLATQRLSIFRRIAPWLRRRHVLWCRQHWQDRSPENDTAMALIREAAALIQEKKKEPHAMTILQALAELNKYAHAAQDSNVVPIGPWSVALAVLVVGSDMVQESGKLEPQAPIEISEIGQRYDASVERMRAALARTPPA